MKISFKIKHLNWWQKGLQKSQSTVVESASPTSVPNQRTSLFAWYE